MKLVDASTESSWRFEWRTEQGHEWALRWVAGKGEWQRLFRPADPVDGHREGWGPARPVRGLDEPADEDEARAIVTRYAEGSP